MYSLLLASRVNELGLDVRIGKAVVCKLAMI